MQLQAMEKTEKTGKTDRKKALAPAQAPAFPPDGTAAEENAGKAAGQAAKRATLQKTRQAVRCALPHTLPVLAGYLSLGFAFGLLLRQNGFGVGWAALSSVFIYAGSAQFLGVELLASGASAAQTAAVVLALNFRHFFYGLSMITRYRHTGAAKPYLIFGLTDETYAVLSATPAPQGVNEGAFALWVTLLNHLYWVAGSVLGGVAGGLLPLNTEGLDFAMTALFAVLFVEQWKAHTDHRAQLLGLGVILLCLKLFGTQRFLLPGLAVISAALLGLEAWDKKHPKKEGNP